MFLQRQNYSSGRVSKVARNFGANTYNDLGYGSEDETVMFPRLCRPKTDPAQLSPVSLVLLHWLRTSEHGKHFRLTAFIRIDYTNCRLTK